MDWLEQNLDAYRIIAEILNDLREILRSELEAIHGTTWYRDGLPDGLLDCLVEFKEKEKAIDWYESEYQQIMNYAVFPDLLQILEHNSGAFPTIMRLAPTTALLHARFLELEVMRSKLGRARPISETELAFLGTFHLRFRKSMDDFRAQTKDRRPAAASRATGTAAGQSVTAPPPHSAPATASDDPGRSAKPVAPEPKMPPATSPEPGPPRRQARPSAPAEGRPKPATEKRDGPPPEEGPAGRDAAADNPPAAQEPEVPALETALARKDDIVVLRALYQEVTGTAESIWSRDVLPSPSVWNKVTASSWYEESFSRLGLKALSDYYEIISKVDAKMREGVSKQDLQQYLKESNFAQILLALRDMFQRNHI